MPTNSTVRSPTLRVSRWLFRSLHPAATKPSRKSHQGRGSPKTFCPRVWLEVAQWVLEDRPVVVVGSHREDAWKVQQRLERIDDDGNGVHVCEIVAGVDDQVGLQSGERTDPCSLVTLVRRQMQVGDVQNANRRRRQVEAGGRRPVEAETAWLPTARRPVLPRQRPRSSAAVGPRGACHPV